MASRDAERLKVLVELVQEEIGGGAGVAGARRRCRGGAAAEASGRRISPMAVELRNRLSARVGSKLRSRACSTIRRRGDWRSCWWRSWSRAGVSHGGAAQARCSMAVTRRRKPQDGGDGLPCAARPDEPGELLAPEQEVARRQRRWRGGRRWLGAGHQALPEGGFDAVMILSRCTCRASRWTRSSG